MNTEPAAKPEIRRLIIPLFVALVVGFYAACGLLYFFQFRDEIQKWWDSRNRHRQPQPSSKDLQHDKESIVVEEFYE